MSNQKQTFHIYGRKAYEKPLEFVGELQLADKSKIHSATFEAFGENDWVELVGIPAKAWLYVTKKEKVG